MQLRQLLRVALALLNAAALHAQAVPTTRRSDATQVYHGVRIADPYRWLEALDSPETRRWARTQDSVTRSWLASSDRMVLRARLAALGRARSVTPPVRRGEFYFWTRLTGGGGSPSATLLVQRGLRGTPREIALTKDVSSRPVRRLLPARQSPVAAFGISSGGGGWETWGFVDVAAGRLLADTLRDMHLASRGVWADGDRAFYYTRFRVPPRDSLATAPLVSLGLYRHRLGSAQQLDARVYIPPGPNCILTPYASPASGSLVIQQSCDGATNSLMLLAPNGTAKVLVPPSAATYRFAGALGDDTYWQTDASAPNFKVVRLRLDGSSPVWTTIVPEDTLPLFSWPGSSLGANLVGRTLLLAYQKDAIALVRAFELDGTPRGTVELPEIGSIWSGFVGAEDSDEAFYSVSGVVSPGTVYRLDVRTGRSTLWARPEIGLPLDSIETRQVFVRSNDGTRFPMFIVKRKDTPLDATAPAWIYGYGFNNWTASPWFQPYIGEFINRGGVWALPNIRGGGEYGAAWNRAGSLLQKHNTVDDYIAATEHLITERYTSAGRIVANASSAGGIVAAAAALRRPELYGAAVLDFPVLDMMRYHLFTVAGTWKAEYGTVDDSAQFEVLRRLSAPHNVRSGVCYPPTLVAPAENDQTTPPFHGYKFVAALQHERRCETNLALLRVSWGSGHGFGKNFGDMVETWTDELAFVERVLRRTRRISADAR